MRRRPDRLPARRRLAARFGHDSVLFAAGTLRACWILGLAFVRPGVAGIVTYRLDQTEKGRVVRTLSAWSISSRTMIAVFTALW